MEQEPIPIEKAETDCIKDILLLTISMLLTKYTQGSDIFYTVTKKIKLSEKLFSVYHSTYHYKYIIIETKLTKK